MQAPQRVVPCTAADSSKGSPQCLHECDSGERSEICEAVAADRSAGVKHISGCSHSRHWSGTRTENHACSGFASEAHPRVDWKLVWLLEKAYVS